MNGVFQCPLPHPPPPSPLFMKTAAQTDTPQLYIYQRRVEQIQNGDDNNLRLVIKRKGGISSG